MATEDLILQIYRETLFFLEESGHLHRLCKTLQDESIDDRMKRVDIPSAGLDTIDAIHCALDKKRTLAFMRSIAQVVRPGHLVVEAGAGTGILAVLAAALGAQVYGLEINKETLGLAKAIAVDFIEKGTIKEECIKLMHADAATWEPPAKIDIIISENIYAGMFYEMQIPIVNHLLEFLSPSGKVIPQSIRSYVALAETEIPQGFKGGDSFSPSDAEGRIYGSSDLSDPALYDEMNFYQKNSLNCRGDLSVPAKKSGLINSLLIFSPVIVAPNIVLRREDMIFMGEDLFIVIDPPILIKKGDVARLRLEYIKGGKPEEGFYEIEISKGF